METILLAFVLNAVLIVLTTIIGAFVGTRSYDGKLYAFICFMVSVGLSFVFWIIYVCAHFIAKFW